MARQAIGLGAAPNDDNGDDLRVAMDKVNDNFIELYNSGSWTPVLQGDSTAGTFVYSIQSGYYVNIGEQVVAFFEVTISSESVAAAGNMGISGLPYNAAANGGGAVYNSWDGLDLSAGYTDLGGRITSGTAIILLRKSGDNLSLAAVTASEVGTAVNLRGFILYRRSI